MTTGLPAPESIGNGYPSFKFSQVGDTVTGTVTHATGRLIEMPNLDPGKPPIEHLAFEIHTPKVVTSKDQYGVATKGQDWSIWMRYRSQQYRALYEAIEASGGPFTEGGEVTITFSDVVPSKRPGMNPSKQFAATYVAPVTGDDGDEEPF